MVKERHTTRNIYNESHNAMVMFKTQLFLLKRREKYINAPFPRGFPLKRGTSYEVSRVTLKPHEVLFYV